MKQSIAQYLMITLMVVGAYFIGMYKTKVEFLEKGNTVAQVQGQQAEQPTSPTTVDAELIKAKFDGKHITFGDKNAKLVITEVSDPSCPYCHIAGGKHPELNDQVGPQFKLSTSGGSYVAPVPEIKKLVDAGKASFLWVYAPGHGSGEVGTQALYCAHEQDKFWEAHDILMSKAGYDLLNNTVKNDLAQSNKVTDVLKGVLDAKKLQSCLDSKKYSGQSAEDTAFVQSLGFGATPTFFINDQVIEGASGWDTSFKAIVDPLI
jgi:protein-disulfide isomerase